jgi:hypothetical protein
MSVGAIIEEVAVKLGLDVEEAGFTKATFVADLLHEAFDKLKEIAIELWHELQNLAPETANFANEARKAALRTGLTTQAFQELSFAAKASGVDVGTLETSLGIMSRVAYGASQGSGEMAAALKKMGISAKDSSGQIKPTDELLEEFAQKFKEMPAGIERNALAMKVFGRAGREMIPFLEKGEEGIHELREEAHQFGMVLDEETIAAAKRYSRNNRELSEAIEGVKLALGGELLKLMGDFKSQLAAAINAIRPGVVNLFRITLRGLTATLKALWLILSPVIWSLKQLASLLVLIVRTAFKDVMMVLNSTIPLVKALGIAALAAGAAFLFGWLMASAPIVLIVAGLAALLLVLEDIKTFFEGGDSYTKDFMEAFGTKAVTFLKTKWGEFIDWFLVKVKSIASSVWSAVKDAFTQFGGAFRAALQTIPGIGKLFGDTTIAPSFGGGDSPRASAQAAVGAMSSSRTSNASNFQVQMSVTVPPGTNPNDVGKVITGGFADWYQAQINDLHAGG